uniref:Uncharacterized protein n=1 Tax=Anguilla anguilla TaxID=7936 RepID=A0A0E9XEW6_ANGAN
MQMNPELGKVALHNPFYSQGSLEPHFGCSAQTRKIFRLNFSMQFLSAVLVYER